MITIRKTKAGYNVNHSQEGVMDSCRTKKRARKIADKLRREKSQMYY